MKDILILIILGTFFVGCSRSSYKNDFDRIERHIEDANKVALTELDSLSKTKTNFSKRDRMNYELLLASAHNTFYISLESDSTMHDVVDYYSKHGTRNQMVRSYYLLGCVYRDKGDAIRAIESYNISVRKADVGSPDCNYHLLSRIYAQMAALFHGQHSPQLELNMWKKAIDYAKVAKDTLAAINFLSHSAGAYHMSGNKKKAVEITRQAYQQYLAYGRRDLAASTVTPIIEDEINRQKYHEAKRYIDEYIQKSDAFDKKGKIAAGRETFYIFVGKYYEGINKNDSALYYYRKTLEITNNIDNLQSCYGGLMSVYQKRHLPDSVAKYASLYAELSDSATVLHSAAEIIKTNALYNYNISQQQAITKEKENNRLQSILYLIVFSVVIASIVLYRYIKKIVLAIKEKLIIENKKYSDLLSRYRKQKGEIDYNTRKRQNYEEKAPLLIKFKDHPIYNKIVSSIDHNNQTLNPSEKITLTDEEWKEFQNIVNDIFPGFIEQLEGPRYLLTSQDVSFCCLVRLEFNYSEIAGIFGCTPQAITKRKRRLFNQFGVESTTAFEKKLKNI